MNRQNHSLILTVMLGLALLLSPMTRVAQASHHVGAGAAPAAPFAENVQGVPSATADWWPAVQDDICQSEYHVTWQERTYLADVAAAYQAPNRAHNLRTYFTPHGIRLIPRVFEGETPPWEWGLTLSGYGLADGVQSVAPATLHSEGNRIEYRHGDPSAGSGPALTGWYINDERGLEQGLTLYTPLSPWKGEGPALSEVEGQGVRVVLELALMGDLAPRLTDDGSAVDLTTADGTTVLRYGPFAATDAAGQPVPLQLRLASGLTIELPTSNLHYPLTLTAHLASPISIMGLSPTPNWTAESDQAGASFGWSVGTAGDVNGDGYSDVIVGAPDYDNGQTGEGRAYVYHGSATGLNTSPAWTAEGDQDGALFGTSLGTAGDVNGDGYADVVVGAYWYSHGEGGEGRAFVYHGGPSGLSPTANWTAEGDWFCAFFGYSVGTAGDVNGDGYSDVIVGAPGYDHGQTDEGRAFVYHGGPGGLSPTAAWIAESDYEGAEFGNAVSTAGDANGDGYSDVIVGAHYYDNYRGAAYAYAGGPAGLSASPAWTDVFPQFGAHFGESVGTVGDVNGDGLSDLIVGAPYYDQSIADNGGWAGIYFGFSATPVWQGVGVADDEHYGLSVGTAGDVNGDGYADVIIGAPGYVNGQADEGRAVVYLGGSGGPSMAWTAEGDQDGALFGTSVGTAGDVDGDGYADVIVGARGYDNGQADEGRALVYHGQPSDPGAAYPWTAERDQASAHFGASVATAGDVNGDGYADLVVGAYAYDDGQADEGAAFVYYGGPNGLPSAPNWSAWGNQVNAYFGWSVGTAGDVNGDGYADLVVGAYARDHGQVDEGQVFVYHGGPTGLSLPVFYWSAEGDQLNAYFGYSVGTAGDVNGDGYADLIVGAYGYDNGQTDEGRAFVYHGAAGGLPSTPSWTGERDQASAWFGSSVGTAGDVNGDGYSDVIVGAVHYTNGQANEGAAFVYYGSPTGLSTAAGWVEGGQDSAWLGTSVGTAGDVNGDGYSDVIVGAPHYTNDQATEGRAYVYHGGAGGFSPGADWSAEGDQAGAYFGSSVGTAGDLNGDGYSDVIVGAPYYDAGFSDPDYGYGFVYFGGAGGLAPNAWVFTSGQASSYGGTSVGTAGDVNGDGYADLVFGAPYYDGGQADEGRAFVFYSNGKGLPMLPRQLRTDGSAPIAFLGMSDSRGGFQLRLTGRMPLGREEVRLQWQAARLGLLFDGPGVFSGVTGWFDTGTGGVVISQNVTGLAPSRRPYHWRVRLLYRPGNRLGQSASRWIHIPWNGWNEADLRLLDPICLYLPLVLRHGP